ncbi:MAG: DUF1254 domain-containing protein [Rhodobacteraceae bacterium]|nr:DUF1254 domain-containing protein [Paracoccaceae bacterium]
MLTVLKRAILGLFLSLFLSPAFAQSTTTFEEQTVADAYVYLLGRALVDRQEKTDIAEPGVNYNVIKYNPVGAADFVNPNLDVAYLEAWIALDDSTTVVLEIPQIEGRYYTAQFCDEWGNVITNINERSYPQNPHGKYAFVTSDSTAEVPEDAVRIVLPSRKAKMLARVELKGDAPGAVVLQKQFRLSTIGAPIISPATDVPVFDNQGLIGVEIFDHADALLSSALDTIPVAPAMQAKVRAIALLAADPEERAALDETIRKIVIPRFFKFAVTEAGAFQNNWLATLVGGIYGDDYWTRAAANLIGIWANSTDEVIYFIATRDGEGNPLNGEKSYVIEFSKDQLPDEVVDGYWSVILVDLPDYRVVPNSLDRFNFNTYSPLQKGNDGSLTLLISPKPDASIPEGNWLPSPDGKPFSLTFRTYVPKGIVKQGGWFPSPIKILE